MFVLSEALEMIRPQMSGIGSRARRAGQMTESLPVDAARFQQIRNKLRRGACSMGIPEMDVDDVVDRALVKAARERVSAVSPPFIVRAQVALRDEMVEYRRRSAARPTIDYEAELPGARCSDDAFHRLALRETVKKLHAALGSEVLEYALLLSAGYSDPQIAARPGWDPLRVGRVRKQMERTRSGKLLSDLIDTDQQRKAS